MSGVVSTIKERGSLQATAVGFIVLVCLILVGLDAHRTWNARSRAVEHATATTENLTGSVAQHAEDTIRTTDGILIALVERLEKDRSDPDALERLRPLLAAEVAALPQLKGLSYLDADGDSIVNSLPMTQRINFADRDYFQFHLIHPDRGPHVGAPVRSKAMGDWIIPVSRRVEHPDGSLAGVMLATVDMAYFQRFYDSLNIGQEGSILLAAADGTLLARRPFSEANIGRSLLTGGIFHDYLPKAAAGTAEVRSSTDGVVRLNSYRRVDSYPLVVAVALGSDEVLSEWREDAWRQAIGAGILAVFVGVLGFRLTRQIGLRVGAEQAAEQAAERVAATAAHYRLLADNSTDMIVRLGFDGVRRYVSPGSRQVYGYEPEELTGTQVDSIIHPDDRDRLAECWRQIERGAERATCTYRSRHKDGHYVWAESTFHRVRTPAGGDAEEMVCVVRDITERVEAL